MSPKERALSELTCWADRWRDLPGLEIVHGAIKVAHEGVTTTTIEVPKAPPPTPEWLAAMRTRYGAFAASLGETRHPDHQ